MITFIWCTKCFLPTDGFLFDFLTRWFVFLYNTFLLYMWRTALVILFIFLYNSQFIGFLLDNRWENNLRKKKKLYIQTDEIKDPNPTRAVWLSSFDAVINSGCLMICEVRTCLCFPCTLSLTQHFPARSNTFQLKMKNPSTILL